MTKAAHHFGKDVRDFLYSDSKKAYIAAALKCGKTPQLTDARPGRHGGTWTHPKLAIRFAQWLDVDFAVWCDAVIEDILTGKAEVTSVKPKESAVMALPSDYLPALEQLVVSVKQGHELAKRWQELKAKQSPSLPNFSNPAEAARAWARASPGPKPWL